MSKTKRDEEPSEGLSPSECSQLAEWCSRKRVAAFLPWLKSNGIGLSQLRVIDSHFLRAAIEELHSVTALQKGVFLGVAKALSESDKSASAHSHSASAEHCAAIREEIAAERIHESEDCEMDGRLYVSSLPPAYSDAMLRELFSAFGRLLSVEVLSGKHLGDALVEFLSADDADEAISELNGGTLPGATQPLAVTRVKQPKDDSKKAATEKKPPTAEMLRGAEPFEQKRILGECLFPKIQALEPRLAAKITGMILDLENSEVLHLLRDSTTLWEKVSEALQLLRNAAIHKQSAAECIPAAVDDSSAESLVFASSCEHSVASGRYVMADGTLLESNPPSIAELVRNAKPPEQKRLIGERLFPKIKALEPRMAGVLTRIILEIDNSELLRLLKDMSALRAEIDKVLGVLRQPILDESHTMEGESAPSGLRVMDDCTLFDTMSENRAKELGITKRLKNEALDIYYDALRETNPSQVESARDFIAIAEPRFAHWYSTLRTEMSRSEDLSESDDLFLSSYRKIQSEKNRPLEFKSVYAENIPHGFGESQLYKLFTSRVVADTVQQKYNEDTAVFRTKQREMEGECTAALKTPELELPIEIESMRHWGLSACIIFKHPQHARAAIVALNGHRSAYVDLASAPLYVGRMLSAEHRSERVFVKNLPLFCDEKMLGDVFSKFGHITNVRLLRNARTGKCRGIGLVQFLKLADSNAAILTMDGVTLEASYKPLFVTRFKDPALRQYAAVGARDSGRGHVGEFEGGFEGRRAPVRRPERRRMVWRQRQG